jgi:hypothetical protein
MKNDETTEIYDTLLFKQAILPLIFQTVVLKSVNSNFTLAVHSQKLIHAKTQFLSHFEGKKREKI